MGGCTARILKQRRVYSSTRGTSEVVYVQLHCPLLGELNLTGDLARRAVEALERRRSVEQGEKEVVDG